MTKPWTARAPGPAEESAGAQAEIQAEIHRLRLANLALVAQYEELAAELDTTNQGVVALYAEIDDKNRQMRAANESKSAFMRNISHELRTPGNSIQGLTRLLLDPAAEPLTADQREQVEYVQSSADDLVRLVNELLDLAQAESGRIELHVGDVDLTALFAELEGTTLPLVTRIGVTLVVEEPVTVRSLVTDRVLLAQVLRNLLSNAVKFTEAGQVLMWAERTSEEIFITVKDTGVGITTGDQSRVFEEFFQVWGPLQVGVSGSGLGLPYARRLAGILGGDLELHSTPGVGTSLVLRLPVAGPLAVGRGGDR